jgi:penicillin-binding protein 1A
MQKTIVEPTAPPHPAPPPPVEPPPVDPFGGGGGDEGPFEPPKLKKLRVAFVAIGLSIIAFISTVFGMMMAVASDIPALENEVQFEKAKNSELLWDTGSDPDRKLATLTGNDNRILVDEHEISPYIKNAVIAIEDKRFYEHRGVDYQGIGRALWQDILAGGAEQGASTITQQFVKNALAAQGDRSVFQKLREAAAAYHLERKWSKQKILTQYLNSIYFGNGAYGIESAMRTYFGEEEGILDENGDPIVPLDPTTGEPIETDEIAAARATPEQAALLAGMIASPSAYDPLQDPVAAKARRDLVLQQMLDQEMISQEQYDAAVVKVPPTDAKVNPPQPQSEEPYFTTWVTQQAVDKFGADRVFGGGMEIKTTLDPELQAAAESAVSQISGIGPSASLVTIENATGEVKAMVGGDSFRERPFNLATNGHRQPGSAFKPFILLAALETGDYGPGSVFTSQPKDIPFINKNGDKDVFHVSNYEDQYSGSASLTTATAQSDNSVYAELGMKIGRQKVAQEANDMGIKTDLSTNPAMLLGGLKTGVTPLEMAFAYSTLANGGKRVCAEWASYKCGPVAIKSVDDEDKPDRDTEEVFSPEVADTAKTMLSYVISSGTGTQAQVGEFAAGKTGTTENYGDAWFCGFIDKYTTCVWMGYPDKLQPMETEYGGSPVAGGTWPAIIWQSFMSQAISIRDTREAEQAAEDDDDTESTPVPVTPAPAPAPEDDAAPAPAPEPDNDAPAPEPAPEPAPTPDEPPAQQPAPDEPAPPPQEPDTEGGGAEPGATRN